MAGCPSGCTCGKHGAYHPACPVGCICAKHDHPGPLNPPCPPGCTCPRHFNRPRGADHPSWKGDDITPAGGNRRAQKLFKLGPCSRCGREPSERHHKDKDPTNNDPSNIEILCRKCHIAADGTIKKCEPGCQCSRHALRPCAAGCACGRHVRAPFSEETRARMREAWVKRREAK